MNRSCVVTAWLLEQALSAMARVFALRSIKEVIA